MKKTQFSGLNQHYKRYSYTYYLDVMERLGFESLELWAGAPHFSLTELRYHDCQTFRHAAECRGLHYVVLTAPSMLWQYNYCPCSRDAFRKSLSYFKSGINAAAELGCKIMTVNSGSGPWDEPYEESIKRSEALIFELAESAQQEGILLAIESLQPIETNLICNLPQMSQFIQKLHHPSLKVMIDLVAIHVAGETPEDWFDRFGHNIIHTHFIDGNPSGHKVFGEGNIPLGEVINNFDKWNYKGYFSFELAEEYAADPASAERRNLKMLERFVSP